MFIKKKIDLIDLLMWILYVFVFLNFHFSILGLNNYFVSMLKNLRASSDLSTFMPYMASTIELTANKRKHLFNLTDSDYTVI